MTLNKRDPAVSKVPTLTKFEMALTLTRKPECDKLSQKVMFVSIPRVLFFPAEKKCQFIEAMTSYTSFYTKRVEVKSYTPTVNNNN